MIHGVLGLPQVAEESACKSSENYHFTELGMYKIHSVALMPKIPFGKARIFSKPIDRSIFINDQETKPTFQSSVKCQNYLTTRYIGRAPLEWYGKGSGSNLGRRFLLVCKGGNPGPKYRVFGTEAAIRGVNRNAGENSYYPGGGST